MSDTAADSAQDLQRRRVVGRTVGSALGSTVIIAFGGAETALLVAIIAAVYSCYALVRAESQHDEAKRSYLATELGALDGRDAVERALAREERYRGRLVTGIAALATASAYGLVLLLTMNPALTSVLARTGFVVVGFTLLRGAWRPRQAAST